MRPTGPAHLGHLVGAFDNWVAMQDELECFYCIVDWHALTTDYANTSELRSNIRELALDFLAVGLDPETLHALRPVARSRARGAPPAALDGGPLAVARTRSDL